MNRIVGFDRKVKLDWLDATVARCQSNKDPDRVQRDLDRLLENEIIGDKARRKTLTILMRIWLKVPASQTRIRDEGLSLVAQIAPHERLWLHWGMSLLAYPFFRDVAAVVGQLGRLQGIVSHAQVQRRMVETWGQRTTLERAVQRVLRTLVEWRVLVNAGPRGSFNFAPVHQTDNRDLALWLMECALRANEAEQVPLRELARLPYNFPFDVTNFVGELQRSRRFEIARQGLDLEMVAIVG